MNKPLQTLPNVKLTAYFPPSPGGYRDAAEAAMEGGALDRYGKPLRTLQAFDPAVPGSYVSIATDRRVIPSNLWVTIDEIPGVVFYACDVGGWIKGEHIDVCVSDRAASYKVPKRGTVHIWAADPRTEGAPNA